MLQEQTSPTTDTFNSIDIVPADFKLRSYFLSAVQMMNKKNRPKGKLSNENVCAACVRCVFVMCVEMNLAAMNLATVSILDMLLSH